MRPTTSADGKEFQEQKDNIQPPHLLDSMLTAVLLIDEEFFISYANPAAEEVLQQSTKRLVGNTIQEFFISNTFPYEDIRRCFRQGNAFHQHDTQITLLNGKNIFPDLNFSRVKQVNNVYVLVEIHHTSLERRLNEDHQRSDQHQATTDLLRRLAHEIKNPLGGLRGAAQLLEQELSDEELKEYTHIIILEADRLRKLVDRMLGPHKVEPKAPCNIHEVLEKARKIVQIQLPQGIVIFRDYDPSLPELMLAPEQVQQAIINLLNNAVQALNNSGNITIRTRAANLIKVGAQTHKLAIRIDIIDDGPGIPEELKSKIFFPLVSGHSKGTGLGLNIAQTLVQQHEGVIECESQAGRTVFSVLIPFKQRENNER